MSCTELYVVESNGDVVSDGELRNSWGGACRIWDAIFKTYFRLGPEMYPGEHKYASWLTLHDEDSKRYWGLHKSEQLPLYARRVFAWTFDEVILPRAEWEQMAKDLDAFDAAFPCESTRVNHIPTLAKWLRGIDRPSVVAVAVNWTSVNADTWSSRPVRKNSEKYRPYNIKKDGAKSLSDYVTVPQ